MHVKLVEKPFCFSENKLSIGMISFARCFVKLKIRFFFDCLYYTHCSKIVTAIKFRMVSLISDESIHFIRKCFHFIFHRALQPSAALKCISKEIRHLFKCDLQLKTMHLKWIIIYDHENTTR